MAHERSWKGYYRYGRRQASRVGRALNASGPGRAFGQGVGRTLGFDYHKGQNMGFMGRKIKPGMPGAGKMAFAMRALGPAFLGMSMYKGYQEGGVLGAAKEGAMEMAMWGAFEAGASVLTNPVMIAAAGAVAAGAGYYAVGQASRKHRKRVRSLEMGGDLVDRFGTMTTMRQRSLSAIQRTHMNSRLALGNEALLLSQHAR
ncbi:hypothetical protein DRQ25_13835 [Candidatus Fermentibacteria bacterium]|nr:MAG: hypothetical protein DRQ25_13835 [Candidatus Fermentibacteria bacterium]